MEDTGPDFMIEDAPGGKILRRGPNIVPLSLFGLGDKTVIGILEVFIPSDGGEHTFNVNSVFNMPVKSSIKEDIVNAAKSKGF